MGSVTLALLICSTKTPTQKETICISNKECKIRRLTRQHCDKLHSIILLLFSSSMTAHLKSDATMWIENNRRFTKLSSCSVPPTDLHASAPTQTSLPRSTQPPPPVRHANTLRSLPCHRILYNFIFMNNRSASEVVVKTKWAKSNVRFQAARPTLAPSSSAWALISKNH